MNDVLNDVLNKPPEARPGSRFIPSDATVCANYIKTINNTHSRNDELNHSYGIEHTGLTFIPKFVPVNVPPA